MRTLSFSGLKMSCVRHPLLLYKKQIAQNNLRYLFWWSTGLQIRTESRKNVRQCHRLHSVFVIIRENQLIVKYIDAVEKNIDNLSPVLLVVRGAIFEPADPLDNILPVVFWLFQFLQTFFGAAGQDALLNGIEYIFNSMVGICKLLAQ